MKKIFILIFLITTLYSSNSQIEQKIYDTILKAVFSHKNSINIWTDSSKKTKFLKLLRYVVIVDTPENADFLIINNTKNIQSNGLKFASSYKMLKYYKNDVIGGFYWQKGRPNILFLRDNLQKKHIFLPETMQEYIENRL